MEKSHCDVHKIMKKSRMLVTHNSLLRLTPVQIHHLVWFESMQTAEKRLLFGNIISNAETVNTQP